MYDTTRVLAQYFPFSFFDLHILTCTEVKRISGDTDRSTFILFTIYARSCDVRTLVLLEFSLETVSKIVIS
jgi:hypothetical protein